MNRAFADAVYWIARINPRDQWHVTFQAVSGRRLVTTDEVLDEVLAHFSAFGPAMRSRTVAIIRQILTHPDIEVVPQSRQSFLDGLAFYEARPDKDYSLTDCVSMTTMRKQGITEVLTRDAHFVQEGFVLIP
jgi:uncharacterized protein